MYYVKTECWVELLLCLNNSLYIVLKQKSFEIYSEYCNNHPHAINKLHSLKQTSIIYQQFFEV